MGQAELRLGLEIADTTCTATGWSLAAIQLAEVERTFCIVSDWVLAELPAESGAPGTTCVPNCHVPLAPVETEFDAGSVLTDEDELVAVVAAEEARSFAGEIATGSEERSTSS